MNKTDLAAHVAAQPHIKRDVICVVVGYQGLPDGEESKKLTDLLQDADTYFGNLRTGHVTTEASDSLHGLKLVSAQAGAYPEFYWEEKYGRVRQQMLRAWLQQDFSVNLLFIEPDPTGTVATYAWTFRGMRPTSTGGDDCGRDPLGTKEPFQYSVSFAPAASTYGFVDNFEQSMEAANKWLKEHPLAPAETPEAPAKPLPEGTKAALRDWQQGDVAQAQNGGNTTLNGVPVSDDVAKRLTSDVGNRPQQRQGKGNRK